MQRVDNLVLLQLHESQIYIEMVCLILTLLNFIMILQICLSLSVNNKAQVVVSLQMQVVAKSSTRILLLIVEACSASHAFSPNTLKMAKNASSNVWTPLSVSQSILKALSRAMANFSSVSCQLLPRKGRAKILWQVYDSIITL